MPSTDLAPWTECLRDTLCAYDEPLLRQVAGRLCRPRNQWPADELVDRCLATIANPPVLDRRLKELDDGTRRVLALIGHSRQPRWRVGNLVELLTALGHSDGLQPVLGLLEGGLLYPDLGNSPAVKTGASAGTRRAARLKSFEDWLGQGSAAGLKVFAHPAVLGRAVGTGLGLGLPVCPGSKALSKGSPREADGLEWLLRLAALWQQAVAAPFRRTQQSDFFKRDLDRLRGDALLNDAPPDNLAPLPDAGLLAVALALSLGVLREEDGEVRAGSFPPEWDEGLSAALAALWASVFCVDGWDPEHGWHPGGGPGNPQPSARLLAVLLLSTLPEGTWADPAAVEQWVLERHPYWALSTSPGRRGMASSGPPAAGLATFLLGFAYHLRLVQAARDERDGWLVRLSPTGRWLLRLTEAPAAPPVYPQTLLVQPNLEILAYRQGLTPALIARLSRFAAWKGFGPACTLQLQPETVYRALEAGETFETLLQALERHGMKATPAPVVDSLRTWAQKRERITVYPSAALFEFASAAELNDALARGLPAVRLSDRLAVVADEGAVDYRHFRLTGTRDYALPPERCVEVEADGVTLVVDPARSDLLLETEVLRFAEPLAPAGAGGKRYYRMTPATLSTGRRAGLTVPALEAWFRQRCGYSLSPAARFLMVGAEAGPVEMRRQVVVRVQAAEQADGLEQWPGTRGLILDRLGPTALLVAEENAAALGECLAQLGFQLLRDQQS